MAFALPLDTRPMEAKLVATLWLAHAIDQNTLITENPPAVPSRSTSAPPPAYTRAYARRKMDVSAPNSVFVSGISACTARTATGSACRSR